MRAPELPRAFAASVAVGLLAVAALFRYARPHSLEPGFRFGLYAGIGLWVTSVCSTLAVVAWRGK